MRIFSVLLMLCLLLTGCGTEAVFETIADEPVQAVLAQPKEIHLQLAGEPVLPAMETEEGTLYLCQGYDVMTQVREGGDLEDTIYTLCGFRREELTVMETSFGDCRRYDFVWTAVSDGGEQVGRASILDDGSYHYCLCAITDAENSAEYQEIWNGIFESFSLA